MLLQVSGLVAGYVPGLPIVIDVSLTAGVGEIVTVIGPNGAGKSTLIKAIAGLLRIEQGEIVGGSSNLVGVRPDQLAEHGVASVPQNANIFQQLQVRQNLVLAARRCERNRRDERVTAMFDLFPALADKSRHRAGTLSGGQRQMLAIAMALIASPRLMLMDEPTAGLAPAAARDVFELIAQIAAAGACVVLVEQNAKAALGAAHRAYVLAEGRNQLEGPASALLADPQVGEVYLGVRRRDH